MVRHGEPTPVYLDEPVASEEAAAQEGRRASSPAPRNSRGKSSRSCNIFVSTTTNAQATRMPRKSPPDDEESATSDVTAGESTPIKTKMSSMEQSRLRSQPTFTHAAWIFGTDDTVPFCADPISLPKMAPDVLDYSPTKESSADVFGKEDKAVNPHQSTKGQLCWRFKIFRGA